jgi:hypothetical protein
LGGKEDSSYSLSTSALDGGEWSASRPGRAFTPGERTPGTHCSTVFLHTHISSGGWTICPLLAAVQRRRLTSSKIYNLHILSEVT